MDVEKLHERLRLAGEEWADLDAAATLLEETKKSVLAKLMAVAEGSVAAREMDALGTLAYTKHVEAMVEARKKANRAKVKYDSARMWCELARTEAATRRAEMGLK